MDQDTPTILKKLIHSDDFLKATALPIDEAHFIQSEHAKKEWEKNNKFRGLGKFFLIILLACTVIRLLMVNPKPLFDLVPMYVYLSAVVFMILLYVAILFFALVFGFKVRKATRVKALKKHLEDQGLIFLDNLDHFSVTVIRKTKDDIDNYLDFKKDQNNYLLWLQKAASLGSYEAKSKLQTLGKEGSDYIGECSAASVIKKALGPIV